ncbi:MAG: FmdB family transcriptional regulator, partial [Chloroflexi bacterium]|nr:FmdB family transcriptional regulator [Chloroflexota bacterium]
EPVNICPKCQGKARRVIHSVPIIFKGSGFYVTDHRKSGDTGKPSSSSKSTSTAKQPTPEKSGDADKQPSSQKSESKVE